MKKTYILMAVAVCAAMLLSSCGILSNNRINKICKFVKENEAMLLQCIAEEDFAKAEELGVTSVNISEEIIDFFWEGAGFGSASSYYGFYYTEDDNMTAIWCSGSPLTADGNGYSWAEEDGDNRYYTEKICDGFYYYEAHF